MLNARALMLVSSVVLLLGAPACGQAADAKAPPKQAPKKVAPQKAAKQPATTVDTVKQMIEGEDVRDFRSFCNIWMQKLADRTTFNTSHIAWKKGGAGVTGEYVTYGTDRTCIAREEPGKDPIGKITYREILYRKEGSSEAAAQGATGTIVEQTDVTEIFRYAKGRWQY